jgi:hypothetical protein
MRNADIGLSRNKQLIEAVLRQLIDAGIPAELGERADAGVDFYVRTPAGDQVYAVQVKTQLSPASAAAIGVRRGEQRLIIAPYVPEAVADIWRRNDIQFVDSVGNMYLRGDGLLVYVRGHRRQAVPTLGEPGQPLRMFKSAGLKVLFLLLCEAKSVDLPYRTVAQMSGASLGTVQWVFKELAEAGFLDSERRSLHRVRELFDRWVEAYILNLWPTLTLARFTAPDPMWWLSADDSLHAVGAQWGGESAAYWLDTKLRPASAVIYAPATPRDLVLAQRFRKADGTGNVEIRYRFWSFDATPPTPVVPTPLVYADLLASTDPRQREAAADLRDHDALLGRIDRT